MPPKRAPLESGNLAPTQYVMRLQGRFGVDEDAREFDFGIGALPVTLGRAPSKTDAPPYHMSLDANDSTLSREHVRIESKGPKKFDIICMSKNGAIVNKNKIYKEERAAVTHNTPIRIGGSRFYVVLPVEPSEPKPRKRKAAAEGEDGAPAKAGRKSKKSIDLDNLKEGDKVTYQQMLDAAFKSGEVEMVDGGATQKDLVDWIMIKFKVVVTTNVASVKKGVYSILNRHYTRVEQEEPQYLDAGKGAPPIRWAQLAD